MGGASSYSFPGQKSPRNYSFWVLSSLLLVSYASQRHYRDMPSDNERHWEGGAMPIYQIRLEEQLNQYANLREEALELHKRYQGKTILFQTFAGIATAKLLLVW